MISPKFKNYKKHLKNLKKLEIVKNKNDEIKFWKNLAEVFYSQIKIQKE